ncbi:PTS system glucose-specific EIIA component [Buchnera aphidicola (Cinara piceae)]|uniref:PTS system glucose-specific EIIA component n=1 Tax=Buchnera aphidicola (Cinara piceae) TaxID=1660043 RepID=A0A803FTC7_9GAMM|nr:PTS glucose transporter subunit IIA [Buchnera aphidicola]VFP87853.1 PTS system glucose-specific EIIA component [Buchnera aphidicola (Cinara piceae)]
MNNKKYIFSPISGIVQNIYETKDFLNYTKKIIIHSTKKIIVSPCDGIIKNYFPKKKNFIIQSNSNINIYIKNKYILKNKKKNNFFSMKKKSTKICSGEIIFIINELTKKNKSMYVQTTIEISCNQKMKKIKNSLYKVKAGITILTYIN